MSDLISKEDAILAILNAESKVARETPYDSEVFSVMAKRQNEILDVLFALPSADRPTGHIVTKCSGKFNPTVWAECSECGKPIDAWDKFCRHCGAKMEGGEDK